MKTIGIKNQKILIDDSDYDSIVQFKWHITPGGYVARTVNRTGKVYLHRQLLGSADSVDHVDRNPLNNTRANLRPATHSQNMRNRSIQKNNTAGYKGVYWREKKRKWEAGIKVNGRYCYLGLFDSLVEAAKAYNRAAVKHYQQFASINNINFKECT